MTIDFFISENHIFVSIFLRDSHFDPYLLFSPLLVPKIKKKRSHFCPFRQCPNGKVLGGKHNTLLANMALMWH